MVWDILFHDLGLLRMLKNGKPAWYPVCSPPISLSGKQIGTLCKIMRPRQQNMDIHQLVH